VFIAFSKILVTVTVWDCSNYNLTNMNVIIDCRVNAVLMHFHVLIKHLIKAW